MLKWPVWLCSVDEPEGAGPEGEEGVLAKEEAKGRECKRKGLDGYLRWDCGCI
jgi:hypothetical protein